MSEAERSAVFVGSSRGGLKIARAIQFQRQDAALESVWNDASKHLPKGEGADTMDV